jgi:hypothetical protein
VYEILCMYMYLFLLIKNMFSAQILQNRLQGESTLTLSEMVAKFMRLF